MALTVGCNCGLPNVKKSTILKKGAFPTLAAAHFARHDPATHSDSVGCDEFFVLPCSSRLLLLFVTFEIFMPRIVRQGGTKTWFTATSIQNSAATVFLKEGIEERTAPILSNPPEGIQVNEWPALTVIDELDQFELRNSSGLTIATGNRDTSLPEPA